MATEYATLVFKADTQEIGEAYNQLKKLNQQGKVTDKTLQSFEKQMKNIRPAASSANGAVVGAGKSLGGMGRQAGQAGIQVQQLVGQVQAGTNPMVALSQQAADLGIVLGLPLLGAVTGIAAAFAGPLISALMGAQDALDDTRERVRELKGSLDELSEVDRTLKLVQIAEEMRTTEKTIRDLEEAQRDSLKQFRELRNESVGFFDAMLLIASGFTSLEDAQRGSTEELATANSALANARDRYKELGDQADILTGKTSASDEATKAQRESLESYLESLEEQHATLGMNAVQLGVYKAMQDGATVSEIRTVRAILEKIEAYKQSAEAAKQAQADELKAQADAEQFRIRLRKAAVVHTERLRKEEAQKQKERIAEEMAARQAADQAVMDRVREMQAAEAELRSVGLLDVERDEFDSYSRRKEMLDQHYADRLITEKQYQDAKQNLERQAQEAAIGQLGEGLNALAQYNESAFKAAKAFNLANAIMNTYTGATKALATYPPPFNFIAAAGVVASGLAQVAAIRSQTYQGRALGGQVRAGESYVVGERGPEVLTMGSGGRITPNEAMRKAGEGQQVSKVANINFQISTVDARGFDQLLQSRRGQIINMVNTAMNDQGRRGVA